MNDFKDTGIIRIKYPDNLRDSVIKTVNLWVKFCELQESIKTAFDYTNDSAGIGYELKIGVGNKSDRKENCDITVSVGRLLANTNVPFNNPIVSEFLSESERLIHLLKPSILDFARDLEMEFNILGLFEEVDNGEDVFFIRFIHYFGERTLGEEIASAHIDQSGFTFHLYESAPGLQCLNFNREWVDMPVSEGETVIIPSMQMQLRASGEIKALCHRVIATEETAKSGRYSVVCFIQLKDTPKYDKNKYGRLQEKEPGFNYDLPFAEIKKLFIK